MDDVQQDSPLADARIAQLPTHEVTNQAPPAGARNLFSADAVLRDAAIWAGAAAHLDELTAFGAALGEPAIEDLGAQANRHAPVLQTFDRQGYRIDRVDFHPGWHVLMRLSVAQGLGAAPWAVRGRAAAGAHVARALGLVMMASIESGHLCPLSMSYSAVATLRHAPDLAACWLPGLLSREYDPAFAPADRKRGLLFGMAMTEKQGGSDLRRITTRAVPDGADGRYRITGHKWFTSAPMCDAFLVLARAEHGVSCFLMPRWTPEGALNGLRFQRLKDKLGNRSNASSEVEFVDALAWRIGEEGRGIPLILEMGNLTRVDSSLSSAGLMHRCVREAVHHATHRQAFGKTLLEQPLMRRVLVDIALEAEAAVTLSLQLAALYAQQQDAGSVALRRLLTPATKLWVCKRGPHLAAEAMEALGGNGYTEDFPLARIYRELPVNAIWEGSGNIMCLDARRAAIRHPEAVEALAVLLRSAAGASAVYDAQVDRLLATLADAGNSDEGDWRGITTAIAVLAQAALLCRHAPAEVAQAYLLTRCEDPAQGLAGGVRGGLAETKILARYGAAAA